MGFAKILTAAVTTVALCAGSAFAATPVAATQTSGIAPHGKKLHRLSAPVSARSNESKAELAAAALIAAGVGTYIAIDSGNGNSPGH